MRQCLHNLSRIFQVARRQDRPYTVLAQKLRQPRQGLDPLPISLSQSPPSPYNLRVSWLQRCRGVFFPSTLGTATLAACPLFARVANGLSHDRGQPVQDSEWMSGSAVGIKNALENSDILHNWQPTMPDTAGSFSSVFELQQPFSPEKGFSPPVFSPVASPAILPSQVYLAQVMEMIHIAFLLHGNIYEGDGPRAEPGAKTPSNKVIILGGDFLLGRASAALPLLGDNDVVELVAGIISNTVEGEMLRMDGLRTPKLGSVDGPRSISEAWDQYTKKTYLKNASLMAKGARAAVLLNGCQVDEVVKDVAYLYGRNLGFARQLMDDACDYELGTSNVQSGMATAPALYAVEEYPEMLPIITRRLSHDGDIECVVDCVRASSGVERTRNLARTYANNAKEALRLLPDSDTVGALEVLIEKTVG